MATARVAIIGDGNVGSALKQGLSRAGYDVQAIGKVPEKVREVARWGEIIVLAVPFKERENALSEMGDAIAGKPLVDVTNAVGREPATGGGHPSGAEELQAMARNAKVVKAFNTAFARTMSTGQLDGERLTAFIAGDDAAAKARIVRLANDIGFDAVDAGPLRTARWIEALGLFHIHLGFTQGLGPDLGIKLVRKGAGAARHR
jgi:predicted dinucleotide-binding enzyme